MLTKDEDDAMELAIDNMGESGFHAVPRTLRSLLDRLRLEKRSIVAYAQIEDIHEAMRELDHAIGDGYSDDVALCLFVARRLAKIRAALAGETKPVGMSAEGLAALDELKKRLNDGSP